MDLVHVPRIDESLRDFGERFAERLFTDAEIAYADSSPTERAARYAARFAAKEATIKALSLSEAGVDWRDMEVERAARRRLFPGVAWTSARSCTQRWASARCWSV